MLKAHCITVGIFLVIGIFIASLVFLDTKLVFMLLMGVIIIILFHAFYALIYSLFANQSNQTLKHMFPWLFLHLYAYDFYEKTKEKKVVLKEQKEKIPKKILWEDFKETYDKLLIELQKRDREGNFAGSKIVIERIQKLEEKYPYFAMRFKYEFDGYMLSKPDTSSEEKSNIIAAEQKEKLFTLTDSKMEF